jgi:hypothetical protein
MTQPVEAGRAAFVDAATANGVPQTEAERHRGGFNQRPDGTWTWTLHPGGREWASSRIEDVIAVAVVEVRRHLAQPAAPRMDIPEANPLIPRRGRRGVNPLLPRKP